MTYQIPENAKIISIDENFAYKFNYCAGSGLKITTDKGDIILVISDEGQCCEHWDGDFLETPDDISKYIGATIVAVEDTNDRYLNDSYESRETQLKIITTKGVLQYAVYNEHNGYYSHATFTQVFDFTERGSL